MTATFQWTNILQYNLTVIKVCLDKFSSNIFPGNEVMAFANNQSFYDLADLIGNDINDWSLPSPGCSDPPLEDSFSEVNTPQFVPQSPSFAPPSKKRKK